MQGRSLAAWSIALAASALAYACSAGDEGSGVGGAGGSSSSVVTVGTGHGVSGSTSSAGGGSPYLACDAPTDAPSHGSCVTVTPGTGGSSSASTGQGGGDSGSGGSGAGAGGSAGMGGMGSACEHVFNPNACADCLVQSCCMQVAACSQTDGCIACFVKDMSAMGCDSPPIVTPLDILQACETGSCGLACHLAVEYHCNPVTNEGCDTTMGFACDLSANGTFECFGPPNEQAICQKCGVTTAGPYCLAGLHCTTNDATATVGECGRYCCDDGDCGPHGHCDTTAVLGGTSTDVGVCLKN